MTHSRRRWVILALIFAAVVLNYFDRQIVSILKPVLRKEFEMDDRGYADLINVFTVCYAVMYPVAGWLVDRVGVKRMMVGGIFMWSLACVGGGVSRGLRMFMVCRGVLGLAEPIAFPAQLRVVTVWFPGSLRATANSVSVAGSSIGSIIAPPLVAWLAIHWNWHVAFLVPGCVGFLLVGLWWGVYRDPVGEIEALNHRSIGALKQGRVFGWGELWGRRSLWGLILCRFVSDPVWYFCLFWFPGYLQEHSGLSLAQVGKVGWIPFLAADLGGIATAMWSDRMVVRRGMEPLQARKVMLCVVAMAGPVCALTPRFSQPWVAIAIFSVVGVVCLSWLFSLSVVIAEAFPAGNVGSVLGIAGGFGAAGAIVFNNYVGRMMQSFGSGRIFLVMAMLHPVAAVILWTMTRRENPVGETR